MFVLAYAGRRGGAQRCSIATSSAEGATRDLWKFSVSTRVGHVRVFKALDRDGFDGAVAPFEQKGSFGLLRGSMDVRRAG